MDGNNNWVDEPVFDGVCPELKAYPAFREAYVNYMFMQHSDNSIIRKEGPIIWPYTMNIGR